MSEAVKNNERVRGLVRNLIQDLRIAFFYKTEDLLATISHTWSCFATSFFFIFAEQKRPRKFFLSAQLL